MGVGLYAGWLTYGTCSALHIQLTDNHVLQFDVVSCIDKGKPEVSGQHALAVPKLKTGHGSETEGVDDILDAVVRTATKKSSDQQPRDRLRARNVDRKSCQFYQSTSVIFSDILLQKKITI